MQKEPSTNDNLTAIAKRVQQKSAKRTDLLKVNYTEQLGNDGARRPRIPKALLWHTTSPLLLLRSHRRFGQNNIHNKSGLEREFLIWPYINIPSKYACTNEVNLGSEEVKATFVSVEGGISSPTTFLGFNLDRNKY